MKIRLGFVSNSSSTSFTCHVCGEVATGMDLSRCDSGMVGCENGHFICNDHVIGDMYNEPTFEQKKEALLRYADFTEEELRKSIEEKGEDYVDDYLNDVEIDILSSQCPICTFQEIDPDDVVEYLFKKHNVTKEEVVEELKERFSSYVEFVEFLK